VWVHAGVVGQAAQITTDATGSQGASTAETSVNYYFPQISGDGEWIAYRRDTGIPGDASMESSSGLWVHNLKSGKSRQVLSELPGSFTWRPGTHQLTYAPAVPGSYFSGNPPDASLARSVMSLDADTNETTELLQPERGYSLAAFQWSPDGRYLGFDELVYIEGRGSFGYYDFETGTYAAWEDRIGNYSWNDSQIYYDRLTYVATGTEEIFFRGLAGGDEQQLTDYEAEYEYAFWPVVSPDGKRIAYLSGTIESDSQTYLLQVQDLAGGEPVPLGSFEAVLNLSWSADGSQLLFSAGPWENQKLMAVKVSDGSAQVLGQGTMIDVVDHIQ
jgi:Tol biopolymer transport system component